MRVNWPFEEANPSWATLDNLCNSEFDSKCTSDSFALPWTSEAGHSANNPVEPHSKAYPRLFSKQQQLFCGLELPMNNLPPCPMIPIGERSGDHLSREGLSYRRRDLGSQSFIPFGINLRYVGTRIPEEHLSGFQSVFLPHPRGEGVAKLVGVPVVVLPPCRHLRLFLRRQPCPPRTAGFALQGGEHLREGERTVAGSLDGVAVTGDVVHGGGSAGWARPALLHVAPHVRGVPGSPTCLRPGRMQLGDRDGRGEQVRFRVGSEERLQDRLSLRADSDGAALASPPRLVLGGTVHPDRPRHVDVTLPKGAGLAGATTGQSLELANPRRVRLRNGRVASTTASGTGSTGADSRTSERPR